MKTKRTKRAVAVSEKDKSVALPSCQHDWAVFSTAVAEGWLMLQCVYCGQHGVVKDPSESEWSDAFHAPTRPYRWTVGQRVSVQPKRTAPYVAVDEGGVLQSVPREVIRSLPPISEEDAHELFGLIPLVEKDNMNSELFVLFIESANEHFRTTPSVCVSNLCRRFKEHSRRGRVYPTRWVVNALRWYAKEGIVGEVH